MNAIIKPIALGVTAYLVSAVGLWFVVSFVLMRFLSSVVWLLPAVTTLVPLFVSGYTAARCTISSHRLRRIAFGVTAGIIGLALALFITHAQGEAWFFGLFIFGAAIVAAAGGFIGTRVKNAL